MPPGYTILDNIAAIAEKTSANVGDKTETETIPENTVSTPVVNATPTQPDTVDNAKPASNTYVKHGDGCLESGIKMIDECGLAKNFGKADVTIDDYIFRLAMAMTIEMGSTEWLGYLLGHSTKTGYHINGISIPVQTVSSTEVDEIETPDDKRIIGTVHSHHHMGAFFSGTDTKYIGGNNELMVVLTSKGESKCAVRYTLECGHVFLKEANLEVLHVDDQKIKDFVEAAKKNIKRKSYTPYYQSYQGGQGFFGQDGRWNPPGSQYGMYQPNQYTNIIKGGTTTQEPPKTQPAKEPKDEDDEMWVPWYGRISINDPQAIRYREYLVSIRGDTEKTKEKAVNQNNINAANNSIPDFADDWDGYYGY
jgi:hypothetical protein